MALNPEIFPSKINELEIKENNYSISYTKEGICTFSSIKGKSEIATTFPDLLYKKNIVGFLDYKRFDPEEPTKWNNDYNLNVQLLNIQKTDDNLVFSGEQEFFLIEPPAFRSFIFYGTITSGQYLFDGRRNKSLIIPDVYVGFPPAVSIYNINSSNIIIDGKIYTLPIDKSLPYNKSSYYLECTQLISFPNPAFTTFFNLGGGTNRSVGSIKALVLYDVPLTEEEVQENLRKLDEYYS